MQIKRAERKLAHLRVTIAGASGSGKSYSALRLASGIGKRIAVIDTENGSASLYADKFRFDVINLEPPFTPDKCVQAIEMIERAGYDTVILDSFSHFWAGEGGTLDKKSALDARGGSGFANWRVPKGEYAKLKNAILHSTCHFICTVRSKQAYVLVDDGNGKQKPKRMGMDPIAEPGWEYETTVYFELAADHTAEATKDRTSLYSGKIFTITEETGAQLMAWLNEGKATEVASTVAKKEEAPKSGLTLKEGAGVQCPLCQAEVVAHHTGAGYVCPNRRIKGDGHLAFSTEKLAEYQSKAAV